jgi:hypothetical protein
MISFKGTHFPKALFFMRISFMSGMAFRIATLKISWKKEGLMLIMLREENIPAYKQFIALAG